MIAPSAGLVSENQAPDVDPGEREGLGLRLISVAGGLGISILVLFAVSQAQRTASPDPEPAIAELRSVIVEPPPPMPMREQTQVRSLTLPDIEPVTDTTGEAIRISLVVPDLKAPVVAPIDFEFNLDALRPRGGTNDEYDPGRVYQRNDVDQRPVLIHRKNPNVSRSMIERISNPRVVLIFIVNSDGSVSGVRPLSSPDENLTRVMTEAVLEWRFRPAMKGGRKVRCLVEQPIFVKVGSGSPFEAR